MSYRMNSLSLFASWCFVQRIGKPLVFLHCLVCNLLGGCQSLSIPHKFSFLEYYYFVVMRGFSIGMQVVHGTMPWMFRTCWWFHMGYDHESFPTSSFATTPTTTATTISSTSVSSDMPTSTSTTAYSIEFWDLRILGDSRSGWMN